MLRWVKTNDWDSALLYVGRLQNYVVALERDGYWERAE